MFFKVTNSIVLLISVFRAFSSLEGAGDGYSKMRDSREILSLETGHATELGSCPQTQWGKAEPEEDEENGDPETVCRASVPTTQLWAFSGTSKPPSAVGS